MCVSCVCMVSVYMCVRMCMNMSVCCMLTCVCPLPIRPSRCGQLSDMWVSEPQPGHLGEALVLAPPAKPTVVTSWPLTRCCLCLLCPQLMENAVFTFTQLLAPHLQGEPARTSAAIEKVKLRVLKVGLNLDYGCAWFLREPRLLPLTPRPLLPSGGHAGDCRCSCWTPVSAGCSQLG